MEQVIGSCSHQCSTVVDVALAMGTVVLYAAIHHSSRKRTKHGKKRSHDFWDFEKTLKK